MTIALLNNRYRIIQSLGMGGFGETFLAEDTADPSLSPCVIKQLKPVVTEDQAYAIAREQFEHEAAILEYLGRENDRIPRVYAYFSQDEEFYLVREWIEGETLAQKVQHQGALNQAYVRDILASLLSVLDYLHAHQKVHRDIKPDNVILRERDEQAILIDFGGIKAAMVNTMDTVAIGTPEFMSAEQAAGQPVYASDLYSVGLTAIYLLTGKTPEELQTDPDTNQFLWQSYIPEVSSTLASVLDKAIQPDPYNRFATAKEMLEALESPQRVSTEASVDVPPNESVDAEAGSKAIHPIFQGRWLNPLAIGILIAGIFVGITAIVSTIATHSPQPTTPDAAPDGSLY